MARLLVLDSSSELLETLQSRLQERGHEVVACNSGKQALAYMEETRFDVFILDLAVSDLTALDMTIKLSSSPLNWSAPIIVTTANPETETLFKVLNAGASFVMAKPFAFETLAEKVIQLLVPKNALKGAFDPYLVRSFLEATVHVVGRLGGVSVVAGRPFLKRDGLALCDSNALTDIRGGGVQGTLCLSFHNDTVESLLTALFGYESEDRFTDALRRDAALEVMNLTIGHAVRSLRRDKGLALRPSGRQFVFGAGESLPYAAQSPVLVVPFTVRTSWPFYLEFSLLVGENEASISAESAARNVYDLGEIVFL